MTDNKSTLKSLPTFIVITILCLCCAKVSAYTENPLGDETYSLSNGLTVIFAPEEISPTVYTAVCVKAGSIYEDEYTGCGISHFIEHTLSASTHNLTKEEIDSIRDRVGGIENAYTTYDHTCYHITTTRNHLSEALYLLSSYVRHAAFDEFYVNQEREVILREIAMGEDEPRNVIYKKFIETIMQEHPVRYPIIGCTDPFKELTRDDLIKYYERMYHPDNTIVVISGGFDRDTATAFVDKYFAGWERKPIRNPVIKEEPPQITPRRARVEQESNLAHVFIGFHTVPITHKDMYPLDVLSTILGGSEGSLLERELIQKRKLAYTVQSYSYTPHFGAGYLAIYAMCEAGKEKEVEDTILEVLSKIEDEISKDDIVTAKRRTQRRFRLSIQTPEDKAGELLSNFLSTGDIHFTDLYLSNLDKVEKEDIIYAWKRYIKKDNMTVVTLGKKIPCEEGVGAIKPSHLEYWTDDIISDTLNNGIKYLIRENQNSDVVSIQFITLGGVRIESVTNSGITNLLLKTMILSSQKRSSEEINLALNEMGTRLKTFVGNNSMGITIDVVREDLEKGMALLSEIINYPSWDEIETARVEILGEIEKQDERPTTFALNTVKRNLYGSHPYSLIPTGDRKVVINLTEEELGDFYERYLPTKETVVSVFGKIDKEKTRELLERYFGRIKKTRSDVPSSLGVDFPDSNIITDCKKDFEQVIICMAFPGIDNRDPDRFAFDVMDAVLTGSYIPSGWLHQALRGEGKGYAYWMHGGNIVGIDRGMYFLMAGTSEEYLDTVRVKMLEVVNRIKEAIVTDKEIEIAKTRCLMAHAKSLEKNSDMGMNAALNELYRLGYSADKDYEASIMGVTTFDIKRIANEYLNKYVLLTIRPSSE